MAAGHQWKHGWIPLTPAAALKKAKGNRALAGKYMDGHGGGAASKVKKAADHSDVTDGHLRELEAHGGREKAEKYAGKLGYSRQSDGSYLKTGAGDGTKSVDLRGAEERKRQADIAARDASAGRKHDRGEATGFAASRVRHETGQRQQRSTDASVQAGRHTDPATIKHGEVHEIHGIDAEGKPVTVHGKVVGSYHQAAFGNDGKDAYSRFTVSDSSGGMVAKNKNVFVRNTAHDPATLKAAKEAGDARYERRNELIAKYRGDYRGPGRNYNEQVHGIDHERMTEADLKELHANLDESDKAGDLLDAGRRHRDVLAKEIENRQAAKAAERKAVADAKVTPAKAAANEAASKAAGQRSEDVRAAAQADPIGKELLTHSFQAPGGSARAAIVRAGEDVGQGDIDGARQRLEQALADARSMGGSFPADRERNAKDAKALRDALKMLDRAKARRAMSA